MFNVGFHKTEGTCQVSIQLGRNISRVLGTAWGLKMFKKHSSPVQTLWYVQQNTNNKTNRRWLGIATVPSSGLENHRYFFVCPQKKGPSEAQYPQQLQSLFVEHLGVPLLSSVEVASGWSMMVMPCSFRFGAKIDLVDHISMLGVLCIDLLALFSS